MSAAGVVSYTRAMKTILGHMKLDNLTCRSIRVSGACWAGRCGDGGMGARAAGRWADMKMVASYCQTGAKKNAAYPPGVGPPDPIYNTWVWKPVTDASTAETLSFTKTPRAEIPPRKRRSH